MRAYLQINFSMFAETLINSYMKLKLSAILMASQALNSIKSTPARPREFSAKLAFWFARLEMEIAGPVKAFEDARLSLFEKHGSKTGEGAAETWMIPKENVEAFTKEINEITEQEEEVKIGQVDISIFEGKETFTTEFFALINAFIKE